MSPARIVASLAVLASLLTGCADTDDAAATSEDAKEQSSLSIAGDGMNPMPVPEPLDVPMPWTKNDFPRLPPSRPLVEDLRDPLGPKGDCALTYLKIHDPVRNEPLEIAVVVCN